MVDDRNPFRGFPTVIAREELACNKLDISSGIELAEHVLEAAKVTGGPNEAAEVDKPVIEKSFDDFCSDKSRPVTRMISRGTIHLDSSRLRSKRNQILPSCGLELEIYKFAASVLKKLTRPLAARSGYPLGMDRSGISAWCDLHTSRWSDNTA
jgi:hypothetical protein